MKWSMRYCPCLETDTMQICTTDSEAFRKFVGQAEVMPLGTCMSCMLMQRLLCFNINCVALKHQPRRRG